jgi:ribosomal protein S18 acetylase RimI-like enzyme
VTSPADVRSITRDDLDAVTQLHLVSFPSSDLTRAGRGVVRRYYQMQWERPEDSRLLVGIWDGGRLAAFICAGDLGDALSRFLRRHRWYLVRTYAAKPRLLLDRQTLGRLRAAAGLSQPRNSRSASGPRYRVLAIATDPDFRGRGYAQRLLQAAEDHARKAGESEIGLTVETDNIDAVGLYVGRGWEPMQEGATWGGSMRKTLRA